jgi:DNA-binding GntR family transcriptional regulator
MTQLDHKQLWEAIADRLREEILDGHQPAGARLVETDLATRFGVSRGPVRDALADLSRSGLVVDLPRRGTFVASLREEDLAEVYEVRRALEEGAVRMAVVRATAEDVAEMDRLLAVTEAAYHAGPLPAAWEADMAFHRVYCRMAGNGRLLQLFDNLASQTVLLMRTALAEHASLAWTPPVEVHRHIADAIRGRDTAGAVRAVADHYQYTEDRLAGRAKTE